MEREWIIRDAGSEQDWDEALELLDTVYVGEGFTKLEDARRTFSKKNLQGQGDLLVATDPNEKIVGAVLLMNETSKLRQVASAGEAEFRLLAVSRHARGKGIGRRLVQECLTRAKDRGASRVVLSTQPEQRTAQKLYEDLGFVRIAARDWHTVGGGARWVYSLELA